MTLKLSKHHFWKWFERNNKEYLELNKKSKKDAAYWMNELNAHLRAYGRFMRFVLDNEVSGRFGILTISAEGKSKYFKKIDDFVAKAPLIPNWEICALEQPCEIDFLIEEDFGYTGIDPHELWFTPMYDDMEDESVDIIVYSSMYTEEHNDAFEMAAAAVLNNLLGERTYGTEIGLIEIDNLSRVTEDVELIKLQELPAWLGNRKSPVVVDGSGRIRGVTY